ncbi:alpha/beta fold hydrolase [Actinotalea subterranea]|uniref:alpha/beta fold hydrolase n=1 Tax=Actinotalea subterranea TaxID=2607497 RepID=UPI0011EC76D7|nr:alpha/beta hydrolase [Actinotalea subterranea]
MVTEHQVTEHHVTTPDGRVLHAFDTGPRTDARLTVVWHHGSPHTGTPLPPLLDAARSRDIRLVTYARPGYGGSTRRPGRDVASAADDVVHVARYLGVDRFATMGASGGGPHALACAALGPGLVAGAVSLAGLAPFTSAFDWFAGMADPGALRSATAGRDARTAFAETEEFDPASFTAADWAALEGDWSSLGQDAGRATQAGPDGLVDDDCAFVTPWGFDPAAVTVPVLLVHGGEDRVVPASHGERLARTVPGAEIWRQPHDGHVSVLARCGDALDWLLASAAPAA